MLNFYHNVYQRFTTHFSVLASGMQTWRTVTRLFNLFVIMKLNPLPSDRLFSLHLIQVILFALSSVAGLCSLSAQTPQVVLKTPSSVLLGDVFSFELTLGNVDGSVIGYDPIVELILPSLPRNEEESDIFPEVLTLCDEWRSASYLGNPMFVEFIGFFDEESGLAENKVTGQTVSGPAGAGLYVLHYPLSSVAPNQPAPVIELTGKVHALTPLEPQDIQARGLFNFGGDPSGEAEAIYGITVEKSIMPALLKLTKSASWPESETATGPSFPGKWTLLGDVAREATLSEVELSDLLPNNFQVTNVDLVRPIDGELSFSGAELGGLLQVNWAELQGSEQNAGSEILIEIEGYVSEYDSEAQLVLSPESGENQSINQFSTSYRFERPGIDPEGGLNFVSHSNFVVLDNLSIALQKDASLVADALPQGLSPEDVVEFVLDLQVSDFKAVEQIKIIDGSRTAANLETDADILGDGLTFDEAFVPTYTATMGGVTVSGLFADGNYAVIENPVGHPLTLLVPVA
jgi:hypothetical protein